MYILSHLAAQEIINLLNKQDTGFRHEKQVYYKETNVTLPSL